MRRLRETRIVLWGIGGGVIASLCSLGPTLAVLLGLSGASFLFGALNDWYYHGLGGLQPQRLYPVARGDRLWGANHPAAGGATR